MKKILWVVLLCFGGSVSLFAQQPATGTQPLESVPVYELPLQDNKALQTAELAAREPGRPMHFATRVEVDINPDTHGQWEVLPGGLAVWRLRLHSPEAYSLNLGFTRYEMAPGGLLLLYSPDLSHLQGPFSRADNEDHAQLWTPILYGDEMVMELQVPATEKDLVQLQLSYVHHDFIGFGLRGSRSGSCNLDVVCGAADGWDIVDDYRDIIQSAGAYSLGGFLACSGALINNARNDCTPYFLTANHCGVSASNAPSMVAYWNFQHSTCRQPGSTASGSVGNGQLNQFNTGAIWRSAWFESDFALVELDDPLDPAHNPFLAGWSMLTPADSMIAIHHPGVEEKRISFDFDPNDWTSWFGNIDSTHIVVNDWDIGTTEGGSSGSPVFDQDKRIIGQLHGGGAACGNNLSDEYGWILKSWTGGGSPSSRLSDWLDPDNTGVQFIDGRNCSFAVSSSAVSQAVCNSSVSTVTYPISVSGGFQGPVTLTLNNLPSGASASFGTNPVAPGGNTTLTLNNLNTVANGAYNFSVQATDGSNSDSTQLSLAVNSTAPATVSLIQPANAATGVSTIASFSWATLAGSTYDIDIATDAAFSNIISSGMGLTTNSYSLTLQPQTQYFWRVRASNACGPGSFSSDWSFTTTQTICSDVSPLVLPVTIPDGPPSVVTSTLNHTPSGSITSVEVVNINGIHTWLEDLTFTLISPQGTRVTLVDQACFNEDDFDVGFVDGAGGTLPCPYDDGNSYAPQDNLSVLIGEDPQGIWTLEVEDHANNDGGEVQGWTLNICQSPNVGIEPAFDIGLVVAPVPSTGRVHVQIDRPLPGDSQIEVVGLDGQVLYQMEWPLGEQKVDLGLEAFANGLYFLRVATPQQVLTRKVVLAR